MIQSLSEESIQSLGFDWPKYALIAEHCVVADDGRIDLAQTIDRLRASREYYDRQLREAFAFKSQHGADYSDFTDRFDDNARMKRELDTAIGYLEEILATVESRPD